MNNQVSLGPLTRRVMQGAKWSDPYPDTQAWADECEQLLAFAQSQDVFGEYFARLQGDNRQRDAALAEIRVARYFSLNGYKPQRDTWKPNGGPNSDGEFVIQGASGSRMVVEVKHPDWQGELTKEEIQTGGAKQSKYTVRQGGAVAPWMAIQRAINKAYGKFDDQTPSLLVVSNDLFLDLKHDPGWHACQALYRIPVPFTVSPFPNVRLRVPRCLYPEFGTNPGNYPWGYFTDSRYEKLGGVGIFIVEGEGYKQVQYELRLYVNAFALPSTKLAGDFVKAFKGVRLWNDPREPNERYKRIGDNDRLDLDRILHILEAKRDALRRYGVKSLSLFGSAARGDAFDRPKAAPLVRPRSGPRSENSHLG